MSPSGQEWTLLAGRFPRVSGDEPRTPHALSIYDMFSPRERG